jgi:hypothetical protein
MEEQIIADNMEQGLGLKQTTFLVNVYRREIGLIDVGYSAVHSGYLRLEPVVTSILDAKQGSYDPYSAWAKARLMFVLQLLVRFGIMTGLAAWACSLQVMLPTRFIPAYFVLATIGSLELTQIVFWDETHKQQQMGGNGNGSPFFLWKPLACLAFSPFFSVFSFLGDNSQNPQVSVARSLTPTAHNLSCSIWLSCTAYMLVSCWKGGRGGGCSTAMSMVADV